MNKIKLLSIMIFGLATFASIYIFSLDISSVNKTFLMIPILMGSLYAGMMWKYE